MKVYKTKNGYFYKEYKNGKKKRISENESKKLKKINKKTVSKKAITKKTITKKTITKKTITKKAITKKAIIKGGKLDTVSNIKHHFKGNNGKDLDGLVKEIQEISKPDELKLFITKMSSGNEAYSNKSPLHLISNKKKVNNNKKHIYQSIYDFYVDKIKNILSIDQIYELLCEHIETPIMPGYGVSKSFKNIIKQSIFEKNITLFEILKIYIQCMTTKNIDKLDKFKEPITETTQSAIFTGKTSYLHAIQSVITGNSNNVIKSKANEFYELYKQTEQKIYREYFETKKAEYVAQITETILQANKFVELIHTELKIDVTISDTSNQEMIEIIFQTTVDFSLQFLESNIILNRDFQTFFNEKLDEKSISQIKLDILILRNKYNILDDTFLTIFELLLCIKFNKLDMTVEQDKIRSIIQVLSTDYFPSNGKNLSNTHKKKNISLIAEFIQTCINNETLISSSKGFLDLLHTFNKRNSLNSLLLKQRAIIKTHQVTNKFSRINIIENDTLKKKITDILNMYLNTSLSKTDILSKIANLERFYLEDDNRHLKNFITKFLEETTIQMRGNRNFEKSYYEYLLKYLYIFKFYNIKSCNLGPHNAKRSVNEIIEQFEFNPEEVNTDITELISKEIVNIDTAIGIYSNRIQTTPNNKNTANNLNIFKYKKVLVQNLLYINEHSYSNDSKESCVNNIYELFILFNDIYDNYLKYDPDSLNNSFLELVPDLPTVLSELLFVSRQFYSKQLIKNFMDYDIGNTTLSNITDKLLNNFKATQFAEDYYTKNLVTNKLNSFKENRTSALTQIQNELKKKVNTATVAAATVVGAAVAGPVGAAVGLTGTQQFIASLNNGPPPTNNDYRKYLEQNLNSVYNKEVIIAKQIQNFKYFFVQIFKNPFIFKCLDTHNQNNESQFSRNFKKTLEQEITSKLTRESIISNLKKYYKYYDAILLTMYLRKRLKIFASNNYQLSENQAKEYKNESMNMTMKKKVSKIIRKAEYKKQGQVENKKGVKINNDIKHNGVPKDSELILRKIIEETNYLNDNTEHSFKFDLAVFSNITQGQVFKFMLFQDPKSLRHTKDTFIQCLNLISVMFYKFLLQEPIEYYKYLVDIKTFSTDDAYDYLIKLSSKFRLFDSLNFNDNLINITL
jgi:hypothetical protein